MKDALQSQTINPIFPAEISKTDGMVILLIKKQLGVITDYTRKTTLKLPIQKEISKDDRELTQVCKLQGMVRGRQRCREKGGPWENVTGPPAACVLF